MSPSPPSTLIRIGTRLPAVRLASAKGFTESGLTSSGRERTRQSRLLDIVVGVPFLCPCLELYARTWAVICLDRHLHSQYLKLIPGSTAYS